MVLVSVARHDRLRGWSSPEDDANELLQVKELGDAVRAIYKTDAHMMMYAADDGSSVHRVRKAGVAVYPKPLVVTTFLADWDTPNHVPWANPMEAVELVMKWREIPMLKRAGFFVSYRGVRIIQPLASPIPVQHADRYYNRWLADLRHNGVEYDPECKGVLRVWRLANVRRVDRKTGRPFDFMSPLVLLDQMTPIELEPFPAPDPEVLKEDSPAAVPASARPRARVTTPVAPQTAEVGEPWCFRVQMLADACLASNDNWHRLFMQLSGALLNKGAPPSRLRAIINAISHATAADTRVDDRSRAADSTLEQYARGAPYAGYRALAEDYRAVALALDESLTIHSAADLERWRSNSQAPELPTADEVGTRIGEILRSLPAGTSIVVAPPGVGKTFKALEYAMERADKAYASPNAKGVRAPRNSKTLLFVDKHKVGRELQEAALQKGISVQRHFGPLSVRDSEGKPECKYHDVAVHVVAGGQPMQRVLCDGNGLRPCEYRDTCKAREGFEGPADARIHIAPHALMRKFEAGSLAVIDEGVPLLEVEAITGPDLEVARASLSDFGDRYASALRPALAVFEAWLRAEPEIEVLRTVEDVVRAHGHAAPADDLKFARVQTGVVDDDLVAFARAAAVDEKGRRAEVPTLRDHAAYLVRKSQEAARRVGRASRVLKTLLHTLATTDKVFIRRTADRDGQRVALIDFPNEALLRMLRESHASVVLDASAGAELPMYEQALGYAPTLHTLEARDAAPVERTHIRAKGANRTAWFPKGTLVVDDGLERCVRDALSWAAERPETRSLGLVTMQHVEVALRAAWRPEDPAPVMDWADLGQPAEVLQAARDRLGPILRAWTGDLSFAHYGDLRGRNDLQELDGLVTLGDPRPNIGQAALHVAYGRYDITPNALADARCAEELNQAHGRLRTVRRTRPARMLHVGSVRPAGAGWARGVVERDLRGGRGMTPGDMDPFELIDHVRRLGGARAAARKVACSHVLLLGCMKGTRVVSRDLASKLRQAA